MKTVRTRVSTKVMNSLFGCIGFVCIVAASVQPAVAQSFNPFAVGAELVKRNGKALPQTEDICCMIDPVAGNYFMYHPTGQEVRNIRDMARIYRSILRGRAPRSALSEFDVRSLRTTLRVSRQRGRRGGIQRRLRAFRAVGRQCLQGSQTFSDNSPFRCEQFAAMNGAQAKLENSSGTLSIIFQDPITSFTAVNILSGSKDDVNSQRLATLSDPTLSLPTRQITFNLDQQTLAMLQDVVDFNIAVVAGSKVFQGDFTELPNGCDDDGAGAGSGSSGNTEANIPDEGYLATTLTNASTGERASCAFEYSDVPLAGAPVRLVANGTYGRILCDFGQSVQVTSMSLFVAPANDGFGVVIDIASFFGGVARPNWTYDLDGGGISGAAEKAVRALYGLDVDGITPANFQPLEITLQTSRGVFKGTYDLPV
jgi:hypothetical protein